MLESDFPATNACSNRKLCGVATRRYNLRVDSSSILVWIYILFAGPLLGWLIEHFNLPGWFVTLPIAPLLFIISQGLLSQRREYLADARAVEITGDPEGTIAALGRLARLSRMPVQGGGMMDSILSHPAMETRVLALARRFGVPDERALAVVRNPDAAYGEPQAAIVEMQQDIVPAASDASPMITLRDRALFQEQLSWVDMIAPLTVI